MRHERMGGASKMRANDTKQCVWGIINKKVNNKEGVGDNWRIFARLIQTIWETDEIPQQMYWLIMVLLPKCVCGYWGIGLLEPLWKCIRIVID